MAKSVYVDFHTNYEGKLPEGVTVGDFISRTRANEIALYLAKLGATEAVDYSVEKGRVMRLDITFQAGTENGDNLSTSLRKWARDIPEVQLDVCLFEEDIGHAIPVFRSQLVASLPHLLGLLAVNGHLNFSIVPEVVLNDTAVNLWQANGWRDRSKVKTTGVTLDGMAASEMQVKKMDNRISRDLFETKICNTLANDSVVFIGDLLQKTQVDVLKYPSTAHKTLNRIQTILGELDPAFKLGLKVAGWNRPPT